MPDKTKKQLKKELEELENKQKSSLKYRRSQLRNQNGELIYDDDNDWSLEQMLQSQQLTDEDYMNEKYWPEDVRIVVENNPELGGKVMTFKYPEGYFDRKYGITLGDALQYRFNQNFQSDWEDYLQHPEDYDIIEVPETEQEMLERRGFEAQIKDNEEREAQREKDEVAREIISRIKQNKREQWEHDHPIQAALQRGLDRGIRWESGVFDKVINQPIGYVMDKGNDLSGGLLYGILSTEPAQQLMNTFTPSKWVGWARTGYNPWDERNTGTGDLEYDNWLNTVTALVPFMKLHKVKGASIYKPVKGTYNRQGKDLYKAAKRDKVVTTNKEYNPKSVVNTGIFDKTTHAAPYGKAPYFQSGEYPNGYFWFNPDDIGDYAPSGEYISPQRPNIVGKDLIVGYDNTPGVSWRQLNDFKAEFIDEEGIANDAMRKSKELLDKKINGYENIANSTHSKIQARNYRDAADWWKNKKQNLTQEEAVNIYKEYLKNYGYYSNGLRRAYQFTPIYNGQVGATPWTAFSYYALKKNLLNGKYEYINYDLLDNIKWSKIGTGTTIGIGFIDNALNLNNNGNIIEYEEPDLNNTWKPKINFNYE